jgi:hypothetical protein
MSKKNKKKNVEKGEAPKLDKKWTMPDLKNLLSAENLRKTAGDLSIWWYVFALAFVISLSCCIPFYANWPAECISRFPGILIPVLLFAWLIYFVALMISAFFGPPDNSAVGYLVGDEAIDAKKFGEATSKVSWREFIAMVSGKRKYFIYFEKVKLTGFQAEFIPDGSCPVKLGYVEIRIFGSAAEIYNLHGAWKEWEAVIRTRVQVALSEAVAKTVAIKTEYEGASGVPVLAAAIFFSNLGKNFSNAFNEHFAGECIKLVARDVFLFEFCQKEWREAR